MPRPRALRRRQRRTVRLLASLAVSLALVLGAVRWWPAPSGGDAPPEIVYAGDQAIEIDEVQPTTQARQQAPPPPPPLPPVVVPDDVVLDPVDLDLSANLFPTDVPGDDPERQEGDDAADASAPAPATEAKLLRYVEPEYTPAARKEKLRAELVVEVLVTPKGRVQEARIVERHLLGADGRPQRAVEQIGYGVEEAVLAAAQQWLFRPARAGGEAVASRRTRAVRFDS